MRQNNYNVSITLYSECILMQLKHVYQMILDLQRRILVRVLSRWS